MTGKEYTSMYRKSRDKAYDALFAAYCDYVYAIVYNKLRSTASREDIEECVSDIIYEIYQKVHTIDLEKGTLRAWTSVVARNRAVNLYRRKVAERNRTAPMGELEYVTDTADSEQTVLDADERKRLLAAVEKLGEPDSTIILRKYYFGQRSREIAEDLGMTASAVDTRLSRAMKKLRTIWGGKE